MPRNWTREIMRAATILLAAFLAIGFAFALEHFTAQTPSVIPQNAPRPIVKKLQTLPSGLGYEMRFSPFSMECFAFPISSPLDPGWYIVQTCPDNTQQGGPPFYGEVILTLPGILRTDALGLWPLDFMPAPEACPGPWQGPTDDPTAGGANVGLLFFVRSTGRLYLCTQAGLRAVTVD